MCIEICYINNIIPISESKPVPIINNGGMSNNLTVTKVSWRIFLEALFLIKLSYFLYGSLIEKGKG